MNTPAEELRAAATRLRETASKATPGPWEDTPDALWIGGQVWGYQIRKDGNFLVGDSGSPDPAWIALASPALAEPLADLLEDAAKAFPDAAVHPDPRFGEQVMHALRVARVINPVGEGAAAGRVPRRAAARAGRPGDEHDGSAAVADPMSPEELEEFRANAPERKGGPLWSLLDWSFWGAGMGDVFREPLADVMLAAVPGNVRAQAEAVMAEFIKIEKTGVTVYQEQRDEVVRLRAELAQMTTARETLSALYSEAECDLTAAHHDLKVCVGEGFTTVTGAAVEAGRRLAAAEAERDKARADLAEEHAKHGELIAEMQRTRQTADEARGETERLRTELSTVAADTLRRFAEVIDNGPASIGTKPIELPPRVYSDLARQEANRAAQKAADHA